MTEYIAIYFVEDVRSAVMAVSALEPSMARKLYHILLFACVHNPTIRKMLSSNPDYMIASSGQDTRCTFFATVHKPKHCPPRQL